MPEFTKLSVPETIERKLMLGFFVVLAVVVGLVVVSVRNTREAGAAADWVNHTHAVILEIDAIQSSLHAAEGAQRSFLLTGDARDQDEYRRAFGEMAGHLSVAKVLLADEHSQLDRLAKLESLAQRRVDLARTSLEARGKSGIDGARQVLIAARARQEELQQIRGVVFLMEQTENLLLQERDHALQESAWNTRATLIAGAALNFILLGTLFWLVRSDLRIRRQAAATLEKWNATLEQKVTERTAELAQSNEALQLENLERQWAHAAMERRYRHVEMIIEAIGEGLVVIGRGGTVIEANDAARRWVGKNSGDLLGSMIHSVLQEEATSAPRSWDKSAIQQAMTKDVSLAGQHGLVLADGGTTKSVVWGCHPVKDGGKVVGAVIVLANNPGA